MCYPRSLWEPKPIPMIRLFNSLQKRDSLDSTIDASTLALSRDLSVLLLSLGSVTAFAFTWPDPTDWTDIEVAGLPLEDIVGDHYRLHQKH